ncbi:hypothetical protein K443DRAFT_686131 [Laccaria amethystina LaAM-08-1]|uniref:Uncharacterized protein n=1 Tax=Laccaria amethystina LaAM-08-1 TaxID=1095629 RepID=A0A0C9X4A3_9AGAR|nr:hypothetical protein K443DRAFT_686131 [Laccaria amethystina LaAM-08-1]
MDDGNLDRPFPSRFILHQASKRRSCASVSFERHSLIDISQEDGEKGQEHIWRWIWHVADAEVKFEGTAKVGCR